ncbi:MAG: hypothetical protein MRECE_1c085 [Mycoplasmataceae bacterium CE_OT135]|nr:MAG: hypothetical protein MRECE_1c085 [Mycoplasmataceae bacterium CE_OT135]
MHYYLFLLCWKPNWKRIRLIDLIFLSF